MPAAAQYGAPATEVWVELLRLRWRPWQYVVTNTDINCARFLSLEISAIELKPLTQSAERS